MDTENDLNYQKKAHPIVVFTDDYRTIDTAENKSQKIIEEKSDDSYILYYLCTCIISILMFSICAWGSQTAFTEIIDLELPLIILFTLILCTCSIQGYAKIGYFIFVIASGIAYLINPSYTFFLVVAITSNFIIKCVELISNNKSDFANKKEEHEGNMIIEHILRVRYYILLSFVIFVIFLLLGYYYAGVFQPLVLPSVQGLNEGVQQGTIKLETISLFINNFTVASNMILSGLYFCITTLYLLAFNAIVVGYTGYTTNLFYFLSFTLPHGIIELFAIILAGAAGFRITHALLTILNGIKIKDENRANIFADHVEIACKMLFDVLVMIIITAVLLIIAAYIEANLTIPIGQYLMQTLY